MPSLVSDEEKLEVLEEKQMKIGTERSTVRCRVLLTLESLLCFTYILSTCRKDRENGENGLSRIEAKLAMILTQLFK